MFGGEYIEGTPDSHFSDALIMTANYELNMSKHLIYF